MPVVFKAQVLLRDRTAPSHVSNTRDDDTFNNIQLLVIPWCVHQQVIVRQRENAGNTTQRVPLGPSQLDG